MCFDKLQRALRVKQSFTIGSIFLIACGAKVAQAEAKTNRLMTAPVGYFAANTSTPPATPAFGLNPGTYQTSHPIPLITKTAGATIYYTTDGSIPTSASLVYTGPINLGTLVGTQNIHAIAVLNGVSSAVAAGIFQIVPNLPQPAFSPAQGTYATPQLVTITKTFPGATIYYTLDGSTPTTSSPVYTGPFTVNPGITRIHAFVAEAGAISSGIEAECYTILPAPPVVNPNGGTFASAQEITLATSTPNSVVYYTTDGSTPSTSSAKYSVPIKLSNPKSPSLITIKAVAAAGGTSSTTAVSPVTTSSLNLVPSSAAYTETPTQSDALVDSIGLNVHLGFLGTPYQNFSLVESALQTLGIRHVRDGLMALSTTWQGYFTEHNQLGQAGIKSDFITSVGQTPALWQSYPQQMAQCFEDFENPNEYDNSGVTNWAGLLSQEVTQLSTAVRNGGISPSYPVYGPSLVNSASYPLIGNISASIDYGNLHNYPGGQNPGTLGWGAPDAQGNAYGGMAWQMDRLNVIAPGLPVVTTETGYTNQLTIAGSVPQSVSAVYLPRLILQQWLANIKRTYLYELVSVGGEDYGLYAADWTAKPAVAAISNLTHLLSDPGPAFQPTTLSYSIAGGDTNLHHLLLQKRNGTYYLALWLEESSYNTSTNAPIVVTPETVQLTLPAGYQTSGYQWDATGAATPVSFTGGASPEITVTDKLLLLQINN